MSTAEPELVLVDATEAALTVLVYIDKKTGETSAEINAHGVTKAQAARIMRSIAERWEREGVDG